MLADTITQSVPAEDSVARKLRMDREAIEAIQTTPLYESIDALRREECVNFDGDVMIDQVVAMRDALLTANGKEIDAALDLIGLIFDRCRRESVASKALNLVEALNRLDQMHEFQRCGRRADRLRNRFILFLDACRRSRGL